LNWLRNISYFSLLLLIAPVFLLLYEGFGPLRNPLGYGVAVFRSIELTLLSSALAALVTVAVILARLKSLTGTPWTIRQLFASLRLGYEKINPCSIP